MNHGIVAHTMMQKNMAAHTLGLNLFLLQTHFRYILELKNQLIQLFLFFNRYNNYTLIPYTTYMVYINKCLFVCTSNLVNLPRTIGASTCNGFVTWVDWRNGCCSCTYCIDCSCAFEPCNRKQIHWFCRQ